MAKRLEQKINAIEGFLLTESNQHWEEAFYVYTGPEFLIWNK